MSILHLLKEHVRLGHAGIIDHSNLLILDSRKKDRKKNGQKQQLKINKNDTIV